MLIITGKYNHKGKIETEYGTTLISDSTNSNVNRFEIEAVYRFKLTQIYLIDFLLEERYYVENEYKKGQANIFGVGIRNNIRLAPNLVLYLEFENLFGNGYFNSGNSNFRIDLNPTMKK